MKISQLIETLPVRLHRGRADTNITAVVDDSRQATPGCLFVARPGTTDDGTRFIADAIQRGAVAVLTHEPVEVDEEITVLLTDDVPATALELANRLHDHPADKLSLIAVTGTNGKTTTAFMIRHLLNTVGKRCGMIGTIEIDTGGAKPQAAELTTPGAIQLTALLAEMVAHGCDACVMEVSSHALDQNRVDPALFDVAIFTNLTGDHLDYHGSMDAYADAKARLFEHLRSDARAVLNADDPAVARMMRDCQAPQLTFGFENTPDCHIALHEATAQSVECTFAGPWGELHVTAPLPGRHNAANLAAALTALHALDLDVMQLQAAVASCPAVPGRLQPVTEPGDDFTVLVDYAHTDDALANVLTALRPVTSHRLRVVFGCGGDRDKTKRPRMANTACQLGDDVVITSDNPRTEDPASILDDILAGVPESMRDSVVVEPDRAAAIRHVIDTAEAGDVILIAGKGHEDYQILGTTKHHFDDREQAAAALADRLTRTR